MRLSQHCLMAKRTSYGRDDTGGAALDRDGADMNVCVYADQNERLLELELIKWGDADILDPDWKTFRIRY